MVLRQRKPYIRARVLEKADRARGRGRLKKAIAGYRQVLQADPKDAAVHGKIAPLLARTGQPSEALASFEAAARIHLDAGFSDRALSTLARLLRRQQRRADARALLEELAPRLSGQDLRRVRRALFWIAPTPAAGWRWLRAALRGR
jgi:tetratricopeptide (TPR) repeat protein